jgi:hypothetical protein
MADRDRTLVECGSLVVGRDARAVVSPHLHASGATAPPRLAEGDIGTSIDIGSAATSVTPSWNRDAAGV